MTTEEPPLWSQQALQNVGHTGIKDGMVTSTLSTGRDTEAAQTVGTGTNVNIEPVDLVCTETAQGNIAINAKGISLYQ